MVTSPSYRILSQLPHLLGKLPERFQWSLHNLVAHPVSEVLFQVGLQELSEKVHDLSAPEPAGDLNKQDLAGILKEKLASGDYTVVRM